MGRIVANRLPCARFVRCGRTACRSSSRDETTDDGECGVPHRRRPIGERDTQRVVFARTAENLFRSDAPVDEGRWIARLTIASGELIWSSEAPLE